MFHVEQSKMPLTRDKKKFIVNNREEFAPCGRWLREAFEESHYIIVSKRSGKDRTIDQNDKMWPMLEDVANQVVWYGKRYDEEQWKDIITGSFLNAEFVPNIENSGFVAIGMRTSKMNRQIFSALIEYLYSFGASQGVKWSEKSEDNYQEVRKAA